MRRSLAWVVVLVTLVTLVIGCRHGAPRGPGDDLPAASGNLDLPTLAWGARAAGGLRVLVIPDSDVAEVEIGVRVAIGSAADPPGKEGLAHLVEHLVFHARDAAGVPLAGRLRALAVAHNAVTTVDATHYLATATVADAPAVAAALAAVAAGPRCEAIDRAALDLERAVVVAERRLRTDDDAVRLSQALLDAGYPAGHPYRRPVIGTEASLARITWDDVCGFLAAYYRPAATFAVVTGPLMREPAFALVAAFDGVAATGAALPAELAPATPARVPAEVTIDADRDTLYLVWPIPPRHAEDGLLARAVVTRLSGALAKARRDGELGDAEVGIVGGAQAPLLVLAVDLDGKSPAAVRAAIGARLRALWDRVDDGDTRFLRAVAVRSLYADVAPFHGRTSVWADYLQFDASEGLFSSDLERLGTITGPALVELTARVFDIDHAAQVVARARPGASPSPAPLATRAIEAPGHAPVDATMPTAPAPRRNVRTLRLPSGLEVVLAPSPLVPLVTARLTVPGGWLGEPVTGMATIAAYALGAGPKRPGRYGWARELPFSWLADYDVAVGPTTTTFTLSTLAPYQDDVVWALAALVTDGVTDDAVRTRLVARLADDPPAAARRAWWAASYGRRDAAAPATPAALSTADLDVYRAIHLRPDGAVLVVTGDFSWSLLEQHLPVAFARWTGGAARAHRPSPQGQWLAVTADEAVVELDLRLPVALTDAAAEARARVAAAILDERIAAVRARLGAAYAVDASLDADPDAPAVVIAARIDEAQIGAAAAVIAEAVEAVRAGAVDAAAVRRGRARALRDLHDAIAGGDGFAAQATAWTRQGHEPGFGADVGAALVDMPDGGATFALGAPVGMVRGRAPAIAAALAALHATADQTFAE